MSISKIYTIDTVDMTLIKTNPPSLVISCSGRTATSGWKNPFLSQYIYVTPPEDGIQEFDFLAESPAPGTITIPVLTPIHGDTLLLDVDIANYWGPGMPLMGVRVHGVANAKIAGMKEEPSMPAPQQLAAGDIGNYQAMVPQTLSFEADIKPKFRTRDVVCMKAVSGFDLHNYEDVKRKAEDINGTLKNKTMPKDGPWPDADIELFGKWIDDGMNP